MTKKQPSAQKSEVVSCEELRKPQVNVEETSEDLSDLDCLIWAQP